MGYSPFSYLRMIWIKLTSQHETQKNCVLSFLCSSTTMFSFLDGWRKDIKGKLHILFYSTPFLATTAAPFPCQRHLFQLAIDKLDNYAEHVFKVSIWELKKIENNINFFNVLFNLFICKLNIVIGLMSHSKLFYYGYL